MTIGFILAQIIGIIALIILIISFQNDNKSKLLKLQIFSSLLYGVQYALLGAYTGALMNVACMIRNCIFNKYKEKKVPIYWLVFVVALMITLSLFSFTGYISLLPMIAVVIYSISMWYGNLKVIRLCEIIACSLFIVYDIKVLAISGLIATIIELISGLIAIYRFDIKKKEV